MAEVAAKEVQKLRQMAGVGMMDAKRALVETEGDVERAMELLRVRGMAKVAKRAGEREAKQGSIGYYLHFQADRPVIGVLVDLACETDFVAKNPEFRKVADDIAMHIAWGKPRWIRREDVDPVELGSEKDFFAAQAREGGKPENVIDRIVEGKVKSYYEDHVLYDQKFARTESFDGTVEALVNDLAARMGENISVRRMAMLRIGEDGQES
ncbi:MAG TPA: elongation factor Ts [Acidimicrobiia bacterium]|jgi:elongation factor Ts|nr:elongation factor Ts [Acidimicrobiia bacterium]